MSKLWNDCDCGDVLDSIVFVGMIIGVVFLVILFLGGLYHSGYKAGQRDAHNGKWKYVMAKNADGEVVWTELEPSTRPEK